MTSFYSLLMQAFGIFSVLASAMLVFIHGMGRDTALLSLIGVAAGWLRFSLAPAGYLTLSPVVFFLSLLIGAPWDALVVGIVSIVLGTVVFHRSQATMREVGEESVPLLVALIAYYFAGAIISRDPSQQVLFPYLAAAIAYVGARFVVGMTSAYAREGIAPTSYLSDAGKDGVVNLALHAFIALALRHFLFDEYGYFPLVLAIVALLELYHPWKLLSEQDAILFANLAMIAQAIDVKDPYTARHSRNVARIAVRIARAMKLPESEVRKVRIGALMHDIGKIGVSTGIIRKPARLDPDEERSMRAHPVISADIIQPIELLEKTAEIVRHHHEHWDGSGYPKGLRGEEIPVGARVVLVADAFDAMTTDRPYRRGRSKQEALAVLKEHAGKQFDAGVVRALETVIDAL
ncbi:MAG: HD-GYP domain-containing protein [Armatimonadota bacterium]|nr:HD-GYP domain-containing protein [Armatimonadota bacterium]MDR7494773.1 HD-GYP domain-containing protein [Armatimonadota bacterium]MDR7499273.1 HD-GYP domain-containing protein [Armatimonadota bacterium]MDR7505097.1 HD-GYP domain-containing protein [Armatimonadota bacterium]MDR7547391.1 HD-GYP domain-containing protein [Armatimonadota bacterium]